MGTQISLTETDISQSLQAQYDLQNNPYIIHRSTGDHFTLHKLTTNSQEQTKEVQDAITQYRTNTCTSISRLKHHFLKKTRSYCSDQESFYLLFHDHGKLTIEAEYNSRKELKKGFNNTQIMSILQTMLAGVKEYHLSFRRTLHNLSLNSVCIEANTYKLYVRDPWISNNSCNSNILNHRGSSKMNFAYFSPQKLEQSRYQEQIQVIQINQFISDLFTIGVYGLQLYFMYTMNQVYNLRKKEINHHYLQSLLEQVNHQELNTLLRILLQINPPRRPDVFRKFNISHQQIRRLPQLFQQNNLKQVKQQELDAITSRTYTSTNQKINDNQFKVTSPITQLGSYPIKRKNIVNNFRPSYELQKSLPYARQSRIIYQNIGNKQTSLSPFNQIKYQNNKVFQKPIPAKLLSIDRPDRKTEKFNKSFTPVSFVKQQIVGPTIHNNPIPNHFNNNMRIYHPNPIKSNIIRTNQINRPTSKSFTENIPINFKQTKPQIIIAQGQQSSSLPKNNDNYASLGIIKNTKTILGEKINNRLQIPRQIQKDIKKPNIPTFFAQKIKDKPQLKAEERQNKIEYKQKNEQSAKIVQQIKEQKVQAIPTVPIIKNQHKVEKQNEGIQEKQPISATLIRQQNNDEQILSYQNHNYNYNSQATPDRAPDRYKYNTTIVEVNEETPQQSEQSIQEQEEYVIEQYQTGSRYQGFKVNGMRNGRGKFFYQDGGHYQGEWKKNKMHGWGKLYYEGGRLAYEGHWSYDQFHGLGKVYNDNPINLTQPFDYTNFDMLDDYWQYYEGTLVSDTKQGRGRIKITNGQYFEGDFHVDRIQGFGKYHTMDGKFIEGIWRESKLIKILNSSN